MKLRRWNCETHKYDDYNVPDEWKIIIYSNNMDEEVNCPHCGKKIKYGESYTSREIHTEMGFGYPVCSECYQEEWHRRETEEGETHVD